MKKSIFKRGTAVLLSILMCLSLLACGASQPTIKLASAGENISLINEDEAAYLADDFGKAGRYAMGAQEMSHPAPVTLAWTLSGGEASGYEVSISENADLTGARVVETTEPTADVYNCKIGTTYYWAVTAALSDGSSCTSDVQSFSTSAQAPRNIFCEGITNMRDCGGWMTESGKAVNQGLLYRSGRMNMDSQQAVRAEITENGQKVMEELGIRTEIDLRRLDTNEVGGLTDTSVLPGVTYIQCPMTGTIGKLMEENGEMVRQVFAVLADESNYPIVYHCSIGTDRTGFITYLVNGLLGVPLEDLHRDYLLSNFAVIGGVRTVSRIQNDYVDGIDAYPGDTLSQRIGNYLLDIGVTQSEMDSIRAIMLG